MDENDNTNGSQAKVRIYALIILWMKMTIQKAVRPSILIMQQLFYGLKWQYKS